MPNESNGHTVHKFKNLQGMQVLVEVGEASYHAPFDHDTVGFLRQVGADRGLIRPEDLDIKGNGHMQMLELNNLEIAAVLNKWIEKKIQ